MSNEDDAAIAVCEERARIGDLELVKTTVIAATDEGVVAFEINTVGRVDSGSTPQAASPAPSSISIADPPERDCKYYCCACDSDHEWYSLEGKGICWVLLLLLFYLLIGVIILPIALPVTVLWFLCCCFMDTD